METRHWRSPESGCKTDFRTSCVFYIYDDGQCAEDENQCHRYGNRSSKGWNRTDILSVCVCYINCTDGQRRGGLEQM